MKKIVFLLMTLTSALVYSAMGQDLPKTISYQGFILDASGNPANTGTYTINFTFQDISGVQLDASATRSVIVSPKKGLFTATIGDGTTTANNGPLPSSYWTQRVKVQVAVDGVNADQFELTSVPFSFMASNIADNVVTTAKIVDGAITNDDISGSAAIAGSKIDGATVANISALNISTGMLPVERGGTGAGMLTGALIGNGSGAFTAVAGTANQYLRRNAANTAFEFGSISLSSSEIADNAITSLKMADNAVNTAELFDNAVTNAKLADNAVGSAEIVADAVTNAKLADNAVNTLEIVNLAVTSGKLADNAVTNAKLADNAVNTLEIADLAVTSNKLADNAVTNAKLADNAVSSNEIATDAITNTKLADNAVNSLEIVDGAVTNTKIGSNAVTSIKIADDAVTVAKIGTAGGTDASKIFTTDGSGNPQLVSNLPSLNVDGFSKLGSDAPVIKMKKLTGVTNVAEGGEVTIAHGLTVSKILSVTVLVEGATDTWYPPNYLHSTELEYYWYLSVAAVRVRNSAANSATIAGGKNIKILITYEQ